MSTAPIAEILTACSLAGSRVLSEVLMIAMRKTTSIRSIVVSFGSRRWKRITPSSERHAPAMIASPRTSSAFASSDPRIDVWATADERNVTLRVVLPAAAPRAPRRPDGSYDDALSTKPAIASVNARRLDSQA
jgi:hypothetical protein